MADWLGITSANIHSKCGEEAANTLAEGLDGVDYWGHLTNETHWFILDLEQTYNITKVRGRSDWSGVPSADPTDVNIYVSTDGVSWGTAVATGITTWQDTSSWVEINTTAKEGRYVKVEIIDTESPSGYLRFGHETTPFTIFDVYGSSSGSGALKVLTSGLMGSCLLDGGLV